MAISSGQGINVIYPDINYKKITKTIVDRFWNCAKLRLRSLHFKKRWRNMAQNIVKEVQFQKPSLRWSGFFWETVAFDCFFGGKVFNKRGKYNQK
jgi:hypothetical protein